MDRNSVPNRKEIYINCKLFVFNRNSFIRQGPDNAMSTVLLKIAIWVLAKVFFILSCL